MQFFGENLSCIRGERLVFSKLNFHVKPGNTLIITGSNGSGKTSLLRLMAGLATPESGYISWGDDPNLEKPENHSERLHYIGHLNALKSTISVLENLKSWSFLHGGNTKKVINAIKSLNLDGLEDIPCGYLSSGQKQRATLARLIASDAPLWLLDEPTNARDPNSVDLLHSLINKHLEKGGMLIIATNTELQVEKYQELKMGNFSANHEILTSDK